MVFSPGCAKAKAKAIRLQTREKAEEIVFGWLMKFCTPGSWDGPKPTNLFHQLPILFWAVHGPTISLGISDGNWRGGRETMVDRWVGGEETGQVAVRLLESTH